MLTIVSFEEHETALNPEHCNFGDEGNIQRTLRVVAICRSFKLIRMKQKSGEKGYKINSIQVISIYFNLRSTPTHLRDLFRIRGKRDF